MFRRAVTPFAFVAALAGCAGSPPSGPFVEARAGITPITRPVPCTGAYALRGTADAPGTVPLYEAHCAKNQRIGFRRELDGSVVAVAPGFELPLVPGAYAWEVVPGSVRPWRERALEASAERWTRAARATADSILMLSIVVGSLALVGLFAAAKSQTPHR